MMENDSILPQMKLASDWSDPEYQFPVKEDYAVPQYRAISRDWLARLKLLRCGDCTGGRLTQYHIREFTRYLIGHQRNETTDIPVGSWAIPETTNMDTVSRVDFVYFPTYIAIAWLCLVSQDHPAVGEEFGDIEQCLTKGLDYASGRNLSGQGYDAIRDMIPAVSILSLGKVFRYTSLHKELSIRFNEAIQTATYRLFDNLLTKESDVSWTKVDEKKVKDAIDLIKGLEINDNVVCNMEIHL